MTTPNQELSKYITQAQMSSFFVNKIGISVVNSSGGDDTKNINNALAALPSNGGTVYLPDSTYTISGQILFVKSGTILQGRNSRTSQSEGTQINSTYSGSSIRCYKPNCVIKDLAINNFGSVGSTIGIDTRPGSSPETETSSFFTMDNVVVKNFKTNVNSLSMSGNFGGWLHRYIDCVFQGDNSSGSIGITCDSNAVDIFNCQIFASEKGIVVGFSKGRVTGEISGCVYGWYGNDGYSNHAILSCEANTQDVKFNDSSTNANNYIHILYSDGSITTDDLPTGFGNVLKFKDKTYGEYHLAPNINTPIYIILDFVTGAVRLKTNYSFGLVASVEKVINGYYKINFSKSISFAGISAQIVDNPNLHISLSANDLTRGIGAASDFTICIADSSGTPTDPLSASAQCVIINMTIPSTLIFSQP